MVQLRDLQRRMRSYLPKTSSLLPLFHVWGIQWIFHAGIQIYYRWYEPSWAEPVSLGIAAVISLVLLFRKPRETEAGEWQMTLWMLLPFAVLALSALLLAYAGAVDWTFGGMIRGLFAAFLYVQLGVLLGRSLVYVGLWLLALSIVVSIFYLGFAPIATELMGGFSLIGAGLLLQAWSRQEARGTADARA